MEHDEARFEKIAAAAAISRSCFLSSTDLNAWLGAAGIFLQFFNLAQEITDDLGSRAGSGRSKRLARL